MTDIFGLFDGALQDTLEKMNPVLLEGVPEKGEWVLIAETEMKNGVLGASNQTNVTIN